MNDLRLLYATERTFPSINGRKIQFLTFETNMGMIYATDSDKLFEIDAEKLEVGMLTFAVLDFMLYC